jgi:hypothetical protein
MNRFCRALVDTLILVGSAFGAIALLWLASLVSIYLVVVVFVIALFILLYLKND